MSIMTARPKPARSTVWQGHWRKRLARVGRPSQQLHKPERCPYRWCIGNGWNKKEWGRNWRGIISPKVARFSLFPSLNYTGQLMQAGEPYGAGRNRKGSSAAVERVFINFFEGHSTR